MKRILSFILILTLCFGLFTAPVFAATEVTNLAWSNYFSSIMQDVDNLALWFSDFWQTQSDGTVPSTLLTFQDLATDVLYLTSWLTPAAEEGFRPTNTPSLWQIMIELGTAAYQYLPYIPTISSNVVTWMTNNNTYLSNLGEALTSIHPGNDTFTIAELQRNAHRFLVGENGIYSLDRFLTSNGTSNTEDSKWSVGSPLGNIAFILQRLNRNLVYSASSLLGHYNDTLTTWEHSTNTQTTFTPTSLANGLYRFLAYIQSDTSSLSYGLVNNYLNNTSFANPIRQLVSHSGLIGADGSYTLYTLSNQALSSTFSSNWKYGSPLGNIAYILQRSHINETLGIDYALNNFRSTQTFTSWTTNGNSTFTPLSATNGIYQWLRYMQIPLARLAFVHADNADIAAKQAAATNENNITTDFIAGSGQASASASDYGALASASGSVKTNFNTGVSAGSVFNVFDRDYEWFSETTFNNLNYDTTVSQNTRNAKKAKAAAESYETEYLDNYYKEIFNLIEENPIEETVVVDNPFLPDPIEDLIQDGES